MDNFANIKQWVQLLGRIFGEAATVKIHFNCDDANRQRWGVYLAGPNVGEVAIYREGSTLAEAIYLALESHLDRQERMVQTAKRMLKEITLRN